MVFLTSKSPIMYHEMFYFTHFLLLNLLLLITLSCCERDKALGPGLCLLIQFFCKALSSSLLCFFSLSVNVTPDFTSWYVQTPLL